MRTTGEESQNESADTAEQSPPEEEPAESPYFFLNNILVTKDVTMVIKDYKVLMPGETGNESGEKPVIAFWYDTTNLSEKEGVTASIAWHAMFRVCQGTDPNSDNELNEAPLPDNTLTETVNTAIKQNGTVSNAIAYYLDSLTAPVVIKATRGASGSIWGSRSTSSIRMRKNPRSLLKLSQTQRQSRNRNRSLCRRQNRNRKQNRRRNPNPNPNPARLPLPPKASARNSRRLWTPTRRFMMNTANF